MRRSVAVALAAALVVSMLGVRTAHACGAAYPGGPVMCDYPRDASSERPPQLRVSASYAYTSTTLRFGGARRADLTRHAVFGGVEGPLSPRWTLFAGAGGVAAATMTHGAARLEGGPGPSAYVGSAYRAVTSDDGTLFLQLTLGLSTTHMRTTTNGRRTDGTLAAVEHASYTAFDLRAGAIFGVTLAQAFTPYAAARAFGGPIFHRYDGEAVRGTDLYKYQLGGGASLALFRRRLDVFAEAIVLGERGASVGLGTTFF